MNEGSFGHLCNSRSTGHCQHERSNIDLYNNSTQVLPPHWLRMFSAGEVNQLLGGGTGGDWDVDDLRRYTHYSGGYGDSSRPCRHFFSVVAAMAPPDRALLLRFVTSCPRPPLGGFRDLHPPFTLHKVGGTHNVVVLHTLAHCTYVHTQGGGGRIDVCCVGRT